MQLQEREWLSGWTVSAGSAQMPFPFPVIGEVMLQQGVKIRTVVLDPDVAQFVDHHQLDGVLRTCLLYTSPSPQD